MGVGWGEREQVGLHHEKFCSHVLLVEMGFSLKSFVCSCYQVACHLIYSLNEGMKGGVDEGTGWKDGINPAPKWGHGMPGI